MATKARPRSPLEVFTRRQTELNRFLWTTELVYGIVKQDKLPENLPQHEPALTNIRRFVVALDAAFPPDPAPP